MGNFQNLIPAFDISQVDTDELLALLQQEFSTSRQQVKILPSGDFESVPHKIVYGNDEICLTFKSGSREVRLIEASPNLPEEKRQHLRSVINEVLIVHNGSDVIEHRAMFSNIPFAASFRYKDVFQLTRIPTGSPKPSELAADHPFLLQFKYRETKYHWLNAVRKSKAFNKVMLLLAGLSPSILGVKVYNPLNVAWKAWVYPPSDEAFNDNQKNFISSKWCQIGYDFPRETLSKESFLRDTLPHTSSSFQYLTSMLDKYDMLSIQDQDKFLRACYWFHQGLIGSSITSTFLNLVIMIEGLLPSDYVPCETCGQPKYQIRQKFRDFLMEYVGEEYKSLASKMYDMRSSIAHSSLTLVGEGNSDFSVGLVPNDIVQRDIVRKMFEMCSSALVNWLIKQPVGNM